MKGRTMLLAAGLAGLGTPAWARDYGQLGQVFPVTEPDLLASIERKLRSLAADGAIARANAAFAQRVEAQVRRPSPVAAVAPATEPRAWTFDPTVRIEHDVRDAGGRLFVSAGQAINPLDFVTMRQALVFVDGDQPAQLAWAVKRYAPLEAKIVMVSGSPLEAMTRWRRRFYFDQQGRLTAKLGVSRTPAVAVQAGRVLRLSEVPLARGGAS